MAIEALTLTALGVWGAAGLWLSYVDLQTRTLPSGVVWGTAWALWVLYSAASALEGEAGGLVNAAIGAAVCGGALAVVHFAHPPSMGFGDVRLATLNGLLCGWWGWRTALMGLAAGFLAALPEAIVTLIREGSRASRPLGPYLVVGAGGVAVWAAATGGLTPFAQ